MDLTEMLDNLMLDLKMTLDTEISTAEATRAIDRAVDDMSRTLPRERIYEHTWIEAVTDDSFLSPAATSDTSIVNAISISAATDGTMATLVTNFNDVPRPVKVTITDADNSITRLTLIVKGTDADGVNREERFYRHSGKVQSGKVYFSTFFEIEINEISGNAAGDTLSVGTTAAASIWIQLDNPIKPESETVYSAALKTGTKFKRDTDYEMDYANGRINIISSGSMAAATTYYTNYNKSQVTIDISDIIPDMIRISKVLYPVDKIPEQSAVFGIWENMLTIGSTLPTVSQKAMVSGEHLAIYYEARHTPPTLVSSGSYSEVLDQVVLIGAAGYSLLMEALQHELQAATDLESMRTELGLTTAVHALITTALAKAAVLVTATTGKIDLALTKVALYLETNDTQDNAKEILANIFDDVAELRTKIIVAQDAIATELGLVGTNSLDKATTGAEAYLDTGDGLINQLNDGGPDVPNKYSDYTRARVQIAQARIQEATTYAQEASIRLSNLRSYIEEAGGWMRMGEIFIAEAQTLIGHVNAIVAEASTRIAQIDRYLNEAAQYSSTADADMVLSDRYRAEAQARLSEFRDILRSKAEYRKRVVSASVRQPG